MQMRTSRKADSHTTARTMRTTPDTRNFVLATTVSASQLQNCVFPANVFHRQPGMEPRIN